MTNYFSDALELNPLKEIRYTDSKSGYSCHAKFISQKHLKGKTIVSIVNFNGEKADINVDAITDLILRDLTYWNNNPGFK